MKLVFSFRVCLCLLPTWTTFCMRWVFSDTNGHKPIACTISSTWKQKNFSPNKIIHTYTQDLNTFKANEAQYLDQSQGYNI